MKVKNGAPDFVQDSNGITHYEEETPLDNINKKLIEIINLLNDSDTKCVSNNSQIYTALASAQAEMGDMTFSGTNTYYHDKYATLGDLVRMTRPALTKYGLAVYQQLYQDENEINYMRTVLTHSSGESIQSNMRISPNKNTVQQIGSYLAHMRRLCYASIVGVMVHDSDDDDGVRCMEEYNARAESGSIPRESHHKEFERISRDEVAELEKSMGMHHDLGQKIMDDYHLSGLADLPKSKYIFVLGQVRKNVALREGNLL